MRLQLRVWLAAGLTALASLALSPLSAQAPQEPAGVPTAAKVTGSDPPVESEELHFTLEARSEGGTITSPAVFALAIQNRSNKTYQITEKIQLKPSDAFVRLRAKDFQWTLDCPSNTLEAQRTLRCDLRAPSVSPSQIGALFSADAVLFLPDDYSVVAVVKYQQAVPGKPKLSERVETKLALAPSLASLMAGGVLGSLLLVLFIGAYRLQQILQAEGLKQLTSSRGVAFALRLGSQALFGSIVAVITIVIIQRVADFDLPISLKIRDFLGGIIVGLFSTKLGEGLQKQFFG